MSLAPPQLPSPAATPDQSSSQHPSPNATEEEIRDQVEKRLLLLSQDLYELEICAGEVVAGQEDRVPNFLQSINEHYVVLNDLGRRMNDTVPFQVVESVDMHRNPHGYTKNALSIATGENQYSLGRVLGLESFRRELHDALGREFPTVPLPERQHQPKIDSGEPEQTKMAQNGTKDGVIKTETSSSTAAVNSASVNPPSAQEPTQTNDAQLPP